MKFEEGRQRGQTDDRIERLLSEGHPETESYLPPGFHALSRYTFRDERRPLRSALRWAGGLTAIAAVVAVAVVTASSRIAPSTPVGTGSAAPAAIASSEAHIPINAVAHPFSAALDRLTRFEGVKCFTATLRTSVPDFPELERLIREAGGDRRWLTPGRSWVGADPSELVGAIEARYAVRAEQDASELWVVIRRDGAPLAVQFMARRTPDGHTVWMERNLIAEAPCVSDS